MKKTILLFLSIVCICCSIFALTACNNNRSTDSGNNQEQTIIEAQLKFTEIKEGENIVAYSVSGIENANATVVNIPSEYNGKPVTFINCSFRGCKSLTSITIPDSVTSIVSAFDGCYKLVEVYNLSSLNITKGSYENGYVGYYALDIYTSKDTPSKLSTTKDGYIFYENNEEVYLIGYKGTETSLVLPDKFNNKNYAIYKFAFYGNANLTSVSIPNSVTSIGESAFQFCTGLISVTIPNSVTSIGKNAFTSCSNLISVTIGNRVNSIGDFAFQYCTGLISVTIPDSVTTIGKNAFTSCSNLISVTIGNRVNSIGYLAFGDCYKLVEVYNLSSLNITKGSTVGSYALDVYTSKAYPSKLSTTNDGYIFYENGEKVYLIDYVGKETNLVLPNKFNNKYYAIYDYAFSYHSSLTSVNIPERVMFIGNEAFLGCERLTSVTIPDSVTSIGNGTFGFCTSLTSLTLPDSVTSIGNSAFFNCIGLTSIIIPNSVTYVGVLAFEGCPIEIATIPAIAISAIKNSKLKTVIITSGDSIDRNAFSGCTGLTSVTLPNTVTTICDYAFNGCTGLTSIIIPSSVKSINWYAFDGCTGLTNVYYCGNVDEWGKISIGAGKSDLTNATKYYYSESEPNLNADGTAYDGNYWHHVDGKPTIWVYVKQN